MKAKYLVALLLTAGMTANVYAAPDKGPQDVNVINDATNPVPVTVQNQSGGCSESQFVGFTTEAFDGGQGVVTYTNACNSTFPGSHMCTSEEFLNTINFPAGISSSKGWIRPVFQPLVWSRTSSDLLIALDASGIKSDPQDLTCKGWGGNLGGTGLRVTGKGIFHTGNCITTSPSPVACCAPAP